MSSSILSFFLKQTFYPNQREALLEIESALNSSKRFVILESDTGTGKTILLGTTSKYLKTSHICCMQKILQEQYVRDLGFPYVKGRNESYCLNNNEKCDIGACQTEKNYPCKYKPSELRDDREVDSQTLLTGEELTEPEFACNSCARGKLYWYSPTHCRYWEQKANGLNSSIVVHNYKYLLTEANKVGDFGPRALLGCDEAHNLDKVLADFVTLQIMDYDLEYIKEHLQDYGNDVQSWIPYLNHLKSRFEAEIESLEEIIKIKEHFKALKLKMEEILEKIVWFLGEYETDPENWVVNVLRIAGNVDCIEFKPVRVDKYAEKYLFRLGHKVICMSATILDPKRFCQRLGIPFNQAVYIKVPSPFNSEKAPIYPMNVGKINATTFEQHLPDIVKTIEYIMGIHKNQKGIIHCTSRKTRDMILKTIGHEAKKRLIVPMSGNKKVAISRHFNINDPSVLLSISDREALDLPDDMSRFQIMTSLPFLGLDDARVMKLMENDSEEYELQMVIGLVQGLGRSIRNVNDYAFSYVLPSQFGYYVMKFDKIFRESGIYPLTYAHFMSRIKWQREGLGRSVI